MVCYRKFIASALLLSMVGLPIAAAGSGPPAVEPAVAGSGLAPSDSVLESESLLVGLYVDNRLLREETIYRKGGDYWVPYPLFQELFGLVVESREGTLVRYQVSLGVISFDEKRLEHFDGIECIALKELTTTFLLTGEFDSRLYGLMLSAPWRPGAREPRRIVADVRAPGNALSTIGLETSSSYDFEGTPKHQLFLTANGRLLDGVWRVDAERDYLGQLTAPRYHWSTFSRNLALRLGTGVSGNYSLLESSPYTGVQIGWNNRSIIKQLDMNRGAAGDEFLTLDVGQTRTISGEAPPASIAELRFDGEPVLRQRVSLDGRYAFSNVRMGNDLRRTEVYLYARSISELPVKVIDYSQSVASRSLPGGELLLRGGVGAQGNPLDGAEAVDRPAIGFAQAMYGVSDRATLEGSVQHDPERRHPDLLVGGVFSPGRHWSTALYLAQSNAATGSDFRVEGRYDSWSLAYWGGLRQSGFGRDDARRLQDHSLRSSWRPLRRMELQLYGRHREEDGAVEASHLLPGALYSPFSWWALSATPDNNREYRYESGFRIARGSNLRLKYYTRIATLDYQQELSRQLTLRAVNDYSTATRRNLANLALNWYPKANGNDLLSSSVSLAEGQAGVSGSWTRHFNTGLRMMLQYRWNMNNVRSLDIDQNDLPGGRANPEKNVSLAVSWDLGWSNNGLRPVNRRAVSLTRGGIAGSFKGEGIEAGELNDITILLNGRRVPQEQVNGSFFVGNLFPGVYTLTVDPEKLPIEYTLGKQSRKVEVRNGAVTSLSIPVEAVYSVAGRVATPAGQGLEGVRLAITTPEGTELMAVTTNQLGYYRSDGLPNGEYLLRIISVGTYSLGSDSPLYPFAIADDYLFGVDFTVEAVAEGDVGSASTR